MNFEHKDILILGDSFCELRSLPIDWPFIVSQKLSNSSEKTRGHGFGGSSWWSVRKRLLKELELHVPKVLILSTNCKIINNLYSLQSEKPQ